MTQHHTEQLIQIFRRLVAAKLTGSLSESARAYSDLDALADHVAIIEEQNGSAAPRPRYGPSARRIEGGAGQRPHVDADDQGQADRDRREGGGRRPRCSPTWPAWAYRRHVCAEPLDARGCGSLHHMPSRQERPTVSLLRLRRADHRGRNRSRTRRRIVARVLGPRPERLSICGAGLCPPEPLIRLKIAASSNADVLEPDGDRLAVRNYLYSYARVIARALAARVAEGFW